MLRHIQACRLLLYFISNLMQRFLKNIVQTKRAGHLICSINSSGRWGARRPGDVCLAPTEAERRMNPWVQLTLPLLKQKKSKSFDLLSFCFKCGRWDLNPHVYTNTRSLVLPVCQFQHFRMFVTSISRDDLVIISNI